MMRCMRYIGVFVIVALTSLVCVIGFTYLNHQDNISNITKENEIKETQKDTNISTGKLKISSSDVSADYTKDE